MRFGFAPVQSQATFAAMQRQARLAEALGFDTLWAHEHHSQGMMYPDPLMTLAALAPATATIRLGTNMLLLPIHHPLRVAEAGAMVDVLSDGRLCLGVAAGYSPLDLRAFGVVQSARAVRLSEGVALIRALWCGQEVTAEGVSFQLEAFRLFPSPLQQPSPPIVIGGSSDKAIDRAARLADGYVISTTETIEDVVKRVDVYRRALAAHDKPWRAPLLNRIVCTVPNAAEKRVAQEFYSKVLLAFYDAWGHANITHLSPEARAVERVSAQHFIIGEPAECVEQIRAYAALGIGHIACLMNFGNPDPALVERSMRLFGERVLPHVVPTDAGNAHVETKAGKT
jgi:alkanesulfonate monooxygenase SsuD/methylene tetrahydromethanopterin reductase-like flavin-dependent oxidoreductase (luciferase family)